MENFPIQNECSMKNIYTIFFLFLFAAQNVVLWYKGEKNIFIDKNRVTPDDRFTVENDHSLTINNVNENDEGIYLCNVQPNNITMKAKLVVLSHLQAHIMQGDRDITDRSITYRQNDRIEVECKATGARSNQVNFKWSSGGNRLASDDNMKIDGGHLIILKANRDNVRVYQCLADNGADGAGHASVTINIQCKYSQKIVMHLIGIRLEFNQMLSSF